MRAGWMAGGMDDGLLACSEGNDPKQWVGGDCDRHSVNERRVHVYYFISCRSANYHHLGRVGGGQ